MHVTGWHSSNNQTEALYWINGARSELPNATGFSGITVFEGNVYIVGSFRQGGISVACYWVNGERFVIPGGRTASSIFIIRE